jgi:hypothetical protein
MLDSDVENREARCAGRRSLHRILNSEIPAEALDLAASILRLFLHMCLRGDIAFVHSFAGFDHGVSSAVVPSKLKKEAL